MSMSLKCKSCGAEIEYAAGSQALKCPYCNSVNEIQKPEDQLPDEVDLIIPLTVSQDILEEIVYGYIASGNYTPDDMLESTTFTKRERFYVPAYLFEIAYEATWTATFGYDRREPYTAYRTVPDSGGGTRREAYTAYRTVTDWRPANGVDEGIFTVSTYAGSALLESPLAPRDLVPYTIAKGNTTSFNPSFMKSVEAESFSVPAVAAFSSLSDEINSDIDTRVKRHAQGDHQRDWHWNAKMRHSSSTLYVPICHAVFDYQGTDYHVWIDGIRESGIRADKLPEDEGRKNLIKLGFIPIGLSLLGLAVATYVWEFTWAGAAVAGVLGAFGALRSQSIIEYSKNIRQSLLTQMKASATALKQLSTEEQEKLARAYQRPEKPFFAKTHQDKVVLPALSLAGLIGVLAPAYMTSPSNFANKVSVAANKAEPPARDVPAKAVTAVPSPPALPTTEQRPATPQEQPNQIASVAPSQGDQQISASQQVGQEQKENMISRSFQEANECLKRTDTACAISNLNKILEVDPNNERAKAGLKKTEVVQRISTCINTKDLDCIEKGANELLQFDPQNQAAMNLLQQVATARSQGGGQKQQAALPNSVAPARTDAAPSQQAPTAEAPKNPQEKCAKKDNFISRELCEARACEKPDYKGHPYCERFAQRSRD